MAYNIYLLSEPRTGGSYLCQLLNVAGISPRIEGESSIPLDNNHENIKMNAKLLGWRYFRSSMTLLSIQEHYPSIKFINLRRSDIIGQAVSEFVLWRTLNFHDYGDNKEHLYKKVFGEDYSKLYNFNYKVQLLQTYHKISSESNRYAIEIKKNNVDSLEVWYEDLMQDKEAELIRILKYLDIGDYCMESLLKYNVTKIQREVYSEVYSITYKIISDSIG